MKTVVCIIFAAVLTCAALPVFAGETVDVRKNADSALFLAGEYSRTNKIYYYIVDRTTGLCFATISHGGLVKIDCEPLKKIEVIKTYLETGKLP